MNLGVNNKPVVNISVQNTVLYNLFVYYMPVYVKLNQNSAA